MSIGMVKFTLYFLSFILSLAIIPVAISKTNLINNKPSFPDSLYIFQPNITNNRAVGVHMPIPPNGTLLLAEINTPGIMRHFWVTNERAKTEQMILDGRVSIRFYWDGHQEPDLEIPLNEFFGNRFSQAEEITFPMERKGKNAYYPMPFRKSAKVELKNNSSENLTAIYWQIDYEIMPEIPVDMPYFNLDTRISKPVSLAATAKEANNHTSSKKELNPNSTLVIAELKGPAVVRQFRITHHELDSIAANRGVVVRIFWDNEKTPSVEVPIGDFFGIGFGEQRDFTSAVWKQKKGNKDILYPMPFKHSARFELVNLTAKQFKSFSWRIDYESGIKFPPDVEYLHACFRISRPVPLNSVHQAMVTIGHGKFVGLVWSHHWINPEKHAEGTQNFWIDGEHIKATGSEDFFGQGWGFSEKKPFAYKGNSYGPVHSIAEGAGDWWKVTAYRALLLDPLHFQRSLKLDLTNYGVDVGHKTDEYDTACFWYQSEPHTPFLALPPAEDLFPIDYPESYAWGIWQIYNLEIVGNYPAELNKIDELLAKYPNNPKAADILLKKGYLLEEQGKLSEAAVIYQEVINRYPTSDAVQDAQDKLWLLDKPSRMLLKMAAPSGCEAYIDGNKVEYDPAIFQNIPDWGVAKVYRFAWPPYKVMWNDIGSIIMRLPTLRLEPGSGEHQIAIKASTLSQKPINSPKRGYFFATIDIIGPDIVTDTTWKLSAQVIDGWQTKEFNVQDWTQAISHSLFLYQDSSWTWLWPKTFRNYPARVDRIWDENYIMHLNKEFKDTLYFRTQFNIP
jgi:hypothetical protein